MLDVGDSIAGAFAGKHLAEFGADVVLLELPNGSLRGLPPFLSDQTAEETGYLHLYVNSGKRSLDMTQAAGGHDSFRSLLQNADLLLLHSHGSQSDELPIDRRTALDANPSLLVVEVTPFGKDVPYSDYACDEIVLYALGGLMYMTGEAHREPLVTYGFQGQYMLGLNATLAALSLIAGIFRGSTARYADVAGMDTASLLLENGIPLYVQERQIRGRAGTGYYRPVPTIDVYYCADGFIVLAAATDAQWRALCLAVEQPDWIDRPDLQDWGGRQQNADEIREGISKWCARLTRREAFDIMQTLRIPIAMGYTLSDVLQDEQHQARGFFVKAEHPVAGTLKYPRLPFLMSEIEPTIGRAPLTGEHTHKVLTEWSKPSEFRAEAEAAQDGSGPALPLEGIRVVDFTQAWAGPFATQMLADLGAYVIKIEGPEHPDILRLWYPPSGVIVEDFYERGGFFHAYNHNKRSLSLNLRREEGRRLLERLVAKCDIVIDNWSKRVGPNLGIDYDRLKQLREDIISLRMPTYGSTGPYENCVGYGECLEAMGGLTMLTGYVGEGPQRTGPALTDAQGSYNAAIALVASLIWRERTAKGQAVDLSQFEALGRALGEELLRVQVSGAQPARRGNRHPVHAPQGCYPCAGDDDWIAVTIQTDDQWVKLCEVLSLQSLSDDTSFKTVAKRRAEHDQLDQAIAAATIGWDKYDLMRLCQENGIPAGAVLTTKDLVNDQHLAARGFFETVEHPVMGPQRLPGRNFKLGPGPIPPIAPSPTFGQHTDEVLQGVLDMGAEEISRLREVQAVGAPPQVESIVGVPY